MKEDCVKEIRCPNCWQDHLAYSRSCDIYKKRKGNIWSKTQEECVPSGTKENSRVPHERKHLCLCCMEGEYNQSREQILSSWRETDRVGTK